MYQSASDFFSRNDISSAAECVSDLVQRHPNFAPGWLLLSRVSERAGKGSLATKSALKSVALEPENVAHLLQLARCYRQAGETSRALAVANRVDAIGNLDEGQLDLLGTVYYKVGDTEAAARCHYKAYQLAPDNPQIVFNAAAAYQTMGDFERAEEFYEKVLRINLYDYDAHAALAQFLKHTQDSNHIDRLKSVLDDIENKTGDQYWEGKHKLCYALAKELEDVSDYDASFNYLQKGSDLRHQRLDYCVADEIAIIDAIIEATQAEFFFSDSAENSGFESNEPVFIVGMPRSGTTLVEQIISSHSQVFAAGELHNFGMAAKRISQDTGAKTFVSVQQLQAMKTINYRQLGEYYIHSTRPRTGNTRHFIDKLPLNVQLCGHIHRALPNARIIMLDRHPLDVCYSNFKLSFKSGYEYSYNLEDLGHYYLAYRRLADHWQKVLPADRFFTISYEKLVDNQEQESRKLLEFCELPWEEQCLQFYSNKEGVATASSAQVRKPIYRSSVQRWKHYEKQLQPLIEILEDGGISVA